MNRNNLIVAGVIAALVLGGLAFFNEGQDGRDGVNGVGAVSTLDAVDNPYVSVNGVRQYFYNQTISATSTIACSVKNPFQATSTLNSYSVAVSATGFGASQNVYVSTSTDAFASSSPALVNAFSTGTGAFYMDWDGPVASSSSAFVLGVDEGTGASRSVLVGPTEFVNFEIATATPTASTGYLTGNCSGVFQKI